MERAGSTGAGGGRDYSPTIEVTSDEEDELMQNASGNRSPIDPEAFIDALQNADSHENHRITNLTAALRSKARAAPTPRMPSRPTPSVSGSAGQMALPSADMPRQASVAPSVAGVNVGNAGQMAVPNQQSMGAPSAFSVHGRSAMSSDPRGNMLYVQQILQQVQHNPDPRLIENLAETLHRSKIENLEQELQAQYASSARMMQDRFNLAVAEERSSFHKEASDAITSLEHGTEANEMRLREELNLAYMAQATSTQNATNADHKLAQVYTEAQNYIQEMKLQSAQHNALMENEIQASKQSFEIQKAKINSQTQELAEQRLLVEKQAGELKEQQLMTSEQRKLFQEQSEYTRKMMADFNSLKEEMNHLKSNDTGDNVRKEAPLTEGRMPVPDEAPNFSTFPVGESSTSKEYQPSNEQQNKPKESDPFQRDDPWKGYKPTNGPTGIPTTFGDNLFGEPKQNTTFPDSGLPHANASGGSAATGNQAESLLRELISALGSSSSNRVPHGSKVKEAETLRFPEFPTPEKYRSWRTAVREEIRAASDRPDEAWTWLLKVYEEREDKRNHMAELGIPADFVTLDTKILAQLSKVARGELARQILTFKDVEAQNKRVVRGRQVLLMFEQYFKTNEEAGALYGTEDLLQVRLQSDDLKSFLQNWDAVIAGMKRIPDENTLKDLFLRQLRKSRRMGYDLDVYDRSADGSHHRSYAYLVQAVRDLLARERLKLNRDRISKSNDMRYSTAASGEHSDSSLRRSPSPRRSPGSSNRGSGICFEYAKKGSCKHGSKCKYKHEKPRDRSHSSKSGRSSSRSSFHSSRSRRSSSGSANRTDKSQVPCRYFKRGHCRRGDSCPFKHESSSTSAAAPTRERAGSPSAKPKGDRRERSGRSQGRRRSSGGDRKSGRSRRDGRSRKPSPRSKSAENSTSAPCIQYACVVIKDDYWEVSESGNVVTRHHINDRDVLFDPCGTKCPFPTRMLSDTRRTRYDQEDYENSCIKDNWRLHDTDKSTNSWTGKTIFRLKSKHQVAMSSQRKKSFKVSFDTKVKTRTFQVEGDMVRHQHIKQTKQKLYPNTYDCPKPKPWDSKKLNFLASCSRLSFLSQEATSRSLFFWLPASFFSFLAHFWCSRSLIFKLLGSRSSFLAQEAASWKLASLKPKKPLLEAKKTSFLKSWRSHFLKSKKLIFWFKSSCATAMFWPKNWF